MISSTNNPYPWYDVKPFTQNTPTSTIYGQLVNGIPHGLAEEVHALGKLNFNFNNGVRNGKFVSTFNNGDVMYGCYNNVGIVEGLAEIHEKERQIRLIYRQGIKQGPAYECNRSGKYFFKYVDDVKDGHVFFYSTTDGSYWHWTYDKGHYKNDCQKLDGNFFKQTAKITSELKNGVPHGKATERMVLGKIEFIFDQGVRQGPFTYYLKSGCMIKGNYKNDVIEGNGEIIDPHGVHTYCTFTQGKVQGLATKYLLDGSRLEFSYVDDIPQGDVTHFKNDGTIWKGKQTNGFLTTPYQLVPTPIQEQSTMTTTTTEKARSDFFEPLQEQSVNAEGNHENAVSDISLMEIESILLGTPFDEYQNIT